MTPMVRHPWLAFAALLLAGALVGCAGTPEQLQPGLSRGEVESRLGPPTAVHALADGTRLQYSRQPAGQQVYNLDLDAQGRLQRVDQVLDLAWLERIEVGRWTEADVVRLLGRPALIERVARFDGKVWTYRYLEPFSLARLVHIHIDPGGVVRQMLYTDEPLPDDPGNKL
jgi:outer membrane protein assembly factor BamE (lipoprotein component of BamABCDE complex)